MPTSSRTHVPYSGPTSFFNSFPESLHNILDSVKEDLLISRLPYFDPDGTTHRITGCYHRPVREALPRSLPTLCPAPRPAYEVRNSPGKGMGLFATRNISAGELVIVERPLAIMPSVLTNLHGWPPERLFDFLLDSLTEEGRKLFFSLSNCKGDELVPGLGILSTNGIGLDLKGGAEKYAAIYPIISRVNHSCGPNTSWSFDYNVFALYLQADRPISKSTEITAAYCPPELSRAQRIYDLKSKYDFTCSCPHCLKFSSKSDSARKELDTWAETQPSYRAWLSSPTRDTRALIKSSIRALVMIRKEGLEGHYAYRHYGDLAQIYGALGDVKKLREWGWKFIMAYKGNAERDEVILAAWMDYLTDPPRYYPNWGIGSKK